MCDLDKFKEAIPILIQGIAEHPIEPKFYEELAKIHLAAGDKLEARKVLIAGIKLLPDNPALLDQYGRLLHDLDEHDSAMLIYEKLRDLDDKDAIYWTMLGNQYLSLELYDLAWVAYKKGKELSPKENSGWILANIGNLLNNKALFTEGIEYLREGISIEPASEYNHNRLSDTLKGQQQEREKAEKIRKQARQKHLTVLSPSTSPKT
jgi:tetratricopeptide (TPR) repeat protein